MKLEGDIDELIFDYLEGDLGKEEQEAFDLLKEENETFAHNVRLWQNAYIDETMPVTTDLEERCMIKGGAGTRVMTNVGIISLIVGVMLFVPSSINDTAIKVSPPDVAVEEIAKQEQQESPLPKRTQTVQVAPLEDSPIIYQGPAPLPELKISELWVTVPIDLEPGTLKPLELTVTKKYRTTYSDRDIERLKRRQLQRRRAAEFKSGNIPYVVPLRNKNF